MHQSVKVNSKFRVIWVISYVAILVGLFFASIGLSEFFSLKLGKQASSYPFGFVNETPWYYKSASIYTTYNLVSGLVFAIATTIIMIALFSQNKRLATIGVLMITIFTISDFISQNINY